MAKDNILLITTDQQRFDTLNAWGNQSIFTPHLNYMAAMGISYKNCYASCPICVPSRTTIMTGRQGYESGVISNETHETFMRACTEERSTLPAVLTDAGYQTCAKGKMHFEPARAHYGFEHMKLPCTLDVVILDHHVCGTIFFCDLIRNLCTGKLGPCICIYFCEDVAAKFDQAVEYIDTDIHIVNQIPEIMNYKENCEYLVVDVEQYADDADAIIDSIMKVKEAVNTKIIIYAVAFSPKSELLSGLYARGIRNYIFSEMLSDKKKDLTNCINGFYEQWGYESLGIYFEGEDEEQTEKLTKKEKVKTIGVAGAVRRMGTTTQALQIVKYLKFNGYKAAYFEMNNHGFVKAVREFYEDSQYDEMEGLTEYQNVDMYYKAERLKEVQDKDYEYIVYDYGVYSEHDFNKVSFLEKDIQIFVVGSKPDEFEKTYDLIKSNFYNDVFYIFNFTSDAEKKDIKELMEDKADKTFFADESKDPFTFGNSKIYSEMIPIEDKSEQKKEKKSGFFRKRKK